MNQQKSISVGLVGHSILRQYPLNRFPTHFNISYQTHVSHITRFHSKQLYKEIISLKPKLDTVIFIIGGNDLDDMDTTEEHHRDISFAFMNTARRFNEANIRPFFLPIQPRRKPNNLSVENYNFLADKMTLSLAIYSERAFGYTAVIKDDISNRGLKWDGIHLTKEDYKELNNHITTHISEHLYKAARAQTPLTKNRDYINQENIYRGHRTVRDINNNSTQTARATSSMSTQTDTKREDKGETKGTQKDREDKDMEEEECSCSKRRKLEATTQTHLTVEGMQMMITSKNIIN